MPVNQQQVAMGAQSALTFVQTLLPVLEATVPSIGAAAGPIGLGISAAALLIPLISQLHLGGTITSEQQAELLNRIANILSGLAFNGPEWQPSNAAAPAPAPAPTT